MWFFEVQRRDIDAGLCQLPKNLDSYKIRAWNLFISALVRDLFPPIIYSRSGTLITTNGVRKSLYQYMVEPISFFENLKINFLMLRSSKTVIVRIIKISKIKMDLSYLLRSRNKKCFFSSILEITALECEPAVTHANC